MTNYDKQQLRIQTTQNHQIRSYRSSNHYEPDLITINDLQNLDKTVLYEQPPNQRNAVLFQAQLLDSNKEDNDVHHDEFWPPPIVSY